MCNYLFIILLLFQPPLLHAQTVSISKSKTSGESYNSLISKAAEAVSREEYNNARILYTQALLSRPSDAFTLKMIQRIDNSLKDIEKGVVHDQDLKRKASINLLLKRAQQEVLDKNYDSATIHYSQLLSLGLVKTQEEFVKQKINTLNLALTNLKNRITPKTFINPPLLIKEKQAEEELVGGNKAIQSAANIAASAQKMVAPEVNSEKNIKLNSSPDKVKPLTPKQRSIEALEKNEQQKKLRIEKQEREQEFNRLINVGDSLIRAQIKEHASNVEENKPSTTATVNNKKSSEAGQSSILQYDEDAKRKAQIDGLIDNALKAIKVEKWSEALLIYSQLQTLKLTPLQAAFVKREIINIYKNPKKVKAKSSFSDSSTNILSYKQLQAKSLSISSSITSDNNRTSSSTTNNSNIAITSQINKNPTKTLVNENVHLSNIVSTEKTFDTTTRNSQHEYEGLIKRIVAQRPNLNLVDSNNNVRLICQNIIANGSNTLLKFLVQNQSTTDFNIGLLQMIYIKNDGSVKKINPQNISGATVILPKQESPLVFITKSPTGIESGEVFIFEMEDLLKRTKLTINLSSANFLKDSYTP